MQHTKSGCGRCCFLCFPDKRPAPVPLMLRKNPPTISVLLHNCNQQRNLRGELERGVRNPVINCFPKRDIFFPYLTKIWLCWSTLETAWIQPCFKMHTKTNDTTVSEDRTLTFRGGAGAVRDAGTSLWCAHAMTAERHQPPHDSSLAGAGVTNNDSSASLTAARFSEDLLQASEEPVSANERCLCGEAGDFKQQRF